VNKFGQTTDTSVVNNGCVRFNGSSRYEMILGWWPIRSTWHISDMIGHSLSSLK